MLEQRLGYSQAQLEGEGLSPLDVSAVAEVGHLGPPIILSPPHGAVAIKMGLKGLQAEAMGVADVQRALREALKAKRPV